MKNRNYIQYFVIQYFRIYFLSDSLFEKNDDRNNCDKHFVIYAKKIELKKSKKQNKTKRN